jgi:ribosomal protein L14
VRPAGSNLILPLRRRKLSCRYGGAKINAQQTGSLVVAPNRGKYKGSKLHGCVRGGLSTELSTRRWIVSV